MFQTRRLRPLVLVSIGVIAGAAAGVGGAAAASSGGPSTTTIATTSSTPGAPGQALVAAEKRLQQLGARLDMSRNGIQTIGIDGPPVHEDLVVLSTSGSFETVTIDSGTVKSVSGGSLTIDEGYSGKTYRTVTLTIPAGANVDRNFAAAKLSDLKAGDHVSVARSPHGTNVTAFDPQNAPARAFKRPLAPSGVPAPRPWRWFIP
jgi:hypothetical protein